MTNKKILEGLFWETVRQLYNNMADVDVLKSRLIWEKDTNAAAQIQGQVKQVETMVAMLEKKKSILKGMIDGETSTKNA